MAPLAAERLERVYREGYNYPGYLGPEMNPLVDIMLEHSMVQLKITIGPEGPEYESVPVDFRRLTISQEAFKDAKKDELPVYVVTPFSLPSEMYSTSAGDWFVRRVVHPIENGYATVAWSTKDNRFDEMGIYFGTNGTNPPLYVPNDTDSFVDGNGKLWYGRPTGKGLFGVVFAGCELIQDRNGHKIPHAAMVFGE